MKKLIPVLFMLTASSSAVADNQFSLGTGFDYSTGKYGGTTSTDILYVPVTAKYELDKLTLKLTVPYISITSAGGVVRGLGRISSVKTKATRTTSSGLGDVTASAGYSIYDNKALALDLVGNVKLGTADQNKGLGTGKNDYSAQVDGYYDIDKTTVFATAGYKVVGVPAGITLNNVAYGTLGVNQKLKDKTSAGIMLDAQQSASPTGAGPRELTAYISQKVSSNMKVQANVLKGLSTGSADFGFGAMITGIF